MMVESEHLCIFTQVFRAFMNKTAGKGTKNKVKSWCVLCNV